MAQFTLAITVVAILLVSQGVDAKRGCAAFGHSCFGGHGKRSEPPMESSQMMVRRELAQGGQEETPPQPEYPRPYNVLQPGDDIIPIRDGGAFDRDNSGAREMKMKLSNIVKHWMDNYRRSQQNDDSYYAENK